MKHKAPDDPSRYGSGVEHSEYVILDVDLLDLTKEELIQLLLDTVAPRQVFPSQDPEVVRSLDPERLYVR